MRHSLPLQGELPPPAVRIPLPLAAKGFRPFFLLAALFACAIVPLWLLVLRGALAPAPYLSPVVWHAHEMVFGFSAAVLAGFLLTAVGNWTQRETLVGRPLLALAGLWVAGRVALVLPGVFSRAGAALVDLAFLPALALVLARPLVATRNRRNFVMLGVLGALSATNLVVHLDHLGLAAAGWSRAASLVAVDVVIFVIAIMAGRVFPMFTRNATGVEAIRSVPLLDRLALGSLALLTALDVALPDAGPTAAVAGVAAVLAALRAATWGTRHTGKNPLLWILHAGYAWIPVGLGLRALSALTPAVPSSLGTHALTAGAIGALTLGMMARVALGHTGRALAVPRGVPLAFGAVLAGAAVRVFAPLLAPARTPEALIAAAALWAIGFGVYVVAYAPICLAPRVDGKPG